MVCLRPLSHVLLCGPRGSYGYVKLLHHNANAQPLSETNPPPQRSLSCIILKPPPEGVGTCRCLMGMGGEDKSSCSIGTHAVGATLNAHNTPTLTPVPPWSICLGSHPEGQEREKTESGQREDKG